MARTVEWVLSHAQEARDTLDAQDAELALAHARIRWLREILLRHPAPTAAKRPWWQFWRGE